MHTWDIEEFIRLELAALVSIEFTEFLVQIAQLGFSD